MKELFIEILDTFENEDIKRFAENCIETAPPYFFAVPASSTGKYHPQYALGDGGLVRHTVALCRFLNHMLAVELIKDQFTSRERDLLRCAGIVHDMYKSGTQEDFEKSKWTKFEHPLIAARWVYDMDGLSQPERLIVAKAVSSHMGQWNTDKRHPDTVLPKPEDRYQLIVHLADYLASRKDIEMQFDGIDTPKSEPETTPDINTWRFPFGKHKGKTIQEVYNEDPGYIKWAKENMDREPAKSLLKKFVVA